MPQICTVCGGEGIFNIEQLHEVAPHLESADCYEILEWIKANPDIEHDMAVCHCCGDGEEFWYGEPGYHYSHEDPPGPYGPYAYNGGLCECH